MNSASIQRLLFCLVCSTFLLAAPLTLAQSAAAAAVERASATAPVDINQADVEKLMTIPNIGEAMARRIVDFREANGPFLAIEDLIKIKGIGEKSFEKLRPYVKVASRR